MSHTNQTIPTIPEQAIRELTIEKDYPDANQLEATIQKYPEHAAALTAFAIELAMDVLRDNDVGDDEHFDPDQLDPAVSRAMSQFQNQLHAKRNQTQEARAPLETTSAVIVINPFSKLDKSQFRVCAERIGANTMFLTMLRDRLIDPASMSDGFIRHVAENVPTEQYILAAHVSAASTVSAPGQFHKADNKPSVVTRQSLRNAVKSAALSSDQQAFLLDL